MAKSTPRGLFVWHDLMTADSDGAVRFYTAVIGWGTQKMDMGPMSYTMWTANGTPVGGVMPMPRDEATIPPHWLGYISTPDVDATVDTARKLGATVMVPPTDIPDIGRFAVLTDPQGAMFALFSPADDRPAPEGGTRPGEFSWHELLAANQQDAWTFYETLFGWEKTSAMDMGETGVYQMFGVGGQPFGGMFNKPAEMPGPPVWSHYVRVDDVKRVIGVVTANGGQVLNGPMEVPGGDWIANCMDPQGAMFSIHSTA
jgi:predicted enzyme related to lactoylglutathione lyase